MLEFADETGLSNPVNPPRRYLWTDAHAVCNFLSLFQRTGEEAFQSLAIDLIDQVHHVLGRHRDDDSRSGWISGLGEAQGREHPTAGGLRIGKTLSERKPGESLDERLEWDRDGQYFHYLTKWMHALSRAADVTGDPKYCLWSMELAKAAHAAFAVAGIIGGRRRLVWKMSIDLSYVLVPSTGLHDSLDGYITYNELTVCATGFAHVTKFPDLDAEIAETEAMNRAKSWQTDDPLGIGGLLFDACRVVQLKQAEHLGAPAMPANLARTAAESLASFVLQAPLDERANYRLAFRELGLSIGLRAITRMRAVVEDQATQFTAEFRQRLDALAEYIPRGEEIENFWSRPENRQVATWAQHRDINRVMLATSLVPDEFLLV